MKNILKIILTIAITIATISFAIIIFTDAYLSIYRKLILILSLAAVYYIANKHGFKYVKIFSIISVVLGVVSIIYKGLHWPLFCSQFVHELIISVRKQMF